MFAAELSDVFRAGDVMKKLANGLPDFADFDELDLDALEAMDDFQQGTLSYDELRSLVGVEAAQAIKRSISEDHDPESLFDDPEMY